MFKCLVFFLLFLPLVNYGQKTKVYLFHGQGSDYRIYSKFKIDSVKYDTILFNYPPIKSNHTMQSYAKIIANQIDTTSKYIFIGISFGGMIVSELNKLLNPDYSVIISSAQNRNEVPKRYRFMKYVPIHRIIPAVLYRGGAKVAQPIIESDRKNEKEIFKIMLKESNPHFIKNVTRLMIGWASDTFQEEIIHIHGTNDNTLPIKNCSVNYTVVNGSHMMLLTRSCEINMIIFKIINPQ